MGRLVIVGYSLGIQQFYNHKLVVEAIFGLVVMVWLYSFRPRKVGYSVGIDAITNSINNFSGAVIIPIDFHPASPGHPKHQLNVAIRPYLRICYLISSKGHIKLHVTCSIAEKSDHSNLYGLAPIPVPHCLQSAGTNILGGLVGPKIFYLNFLILLRPYCFNWLASVNLMLLGIKTKKNDSCYVFGFAGLRLGLPLRFLRSDLPFPVWVRVPDF